MKTKYFLIIIIIFFSINVHAQIHFNKADVQLKGNIKYYEKISYDTKKEAGKYVKGVRKKSWEKDRKIWFNQDGTFKTEQKINQDGSLLQQYNYQYNTDKKPNIITVIFREKADGKIILTYNSKKQLVTEEKFDDSKNSEYKTTYEYDNNNLILTKYYEENELIEENEFMYNKNSQITQHAQIITDEDERQSYYYEYNDKNQLSKESKTNFKGEETETTRYEYDNQGLISMKNTVDWNQNKEKQTFKYDENNNLTEQIIYRDNFETIIYRNKYDSHNNLIEKLEYKGDKLISIYEYKLEYYN